MPNTYETVVGQPDAWAAHKVIEHRRLEARNELVAEVRYLRRVDTRNSLLFERVPIQDRRQVYGLACR